MNTPSILPFVHAHGTWSDIGQQVGAMLAPLIARHVEAWTRHVIDETGASRSAILAAASSFRAPIQAHAPFLWDELEGMVRGSGVPIAELLLLQARAEVLRAQRSTPSDAVRAATECTTFAVGGRRTAAGVLFGQNVDLAPFGEEFGVLVREPRRGARSAPLYPPAGLLGHNGLNEAGVGICANCVGDPAGWGGGLPRYLLSRWALSQDSGEAALEAALAPP